MIISGNIDVNYFLPARLDVISFSDIDDRFDGVVVDRCIDNLKQNITKIRESCRQINRIVKQEISRQDCIPRFTRL